MALRRRATAPSGGAAPPFPKGAAVEVRLNEVGFQGSWYEATVTAAHRRRRTFDVVYASLVADDDPSQPLAESDVAADNIRPRPPRPAAGARYTLHQLVDVFQLDGWWLAVVSAVHGPDRYTVSYPFSREVADHAPFEIRPHLDWRRGRWLPVAPADQARGMFGEGKEVEVSGDRENYGVTWYRGTVKKVIQKAIFLVEYEMAKEDGGRDVVSEILDEQFLRPVPPVTPKGKVFGLLEEVEVYRCGGWMVGVVMNVVEGPAPKYTVELMYGKEDEEIEVGHAEMRLRRQWSNGQWTGMTEECCEGSSHDGRTDDLLNTISSFKYKTGWVTNDGSVECHGRSSIAGKTSDALVSSMSSLGATEQINKMCLKRKFGEEQSCKIESLQPRKELKKGDPSDPSLGEIYPTTPVVELEFPAATKGCESPPNEIVVGNDAEKTAHQSDPAPFKSSVKTLPFVKSSKMWELIETMEVFRMMPQEPTFPQLEQYGSMEVREGMAIGLMVSFTTLVDSIRSLSIDDSQDSFDEKLKALKPLEENGFDVQRIRSRIEELVEIRKDANKGTALEEKILEREEEIARLETLRYTLERTIGEVERSLARLRAEKESVDAHMMDDFSVIAKLQKDVHEAKEAFLLAKHRFNTVLDSPW